MKSLDGDDAPVRGRDNKNQVQFSSRDCVQFVSYQQMENDPQKLTAEILREIPAQITGYFDTKKIKPGKRKDKNLDKFKNNKDTYFPNLLEKIKKQAEAEANCDPEKIDQLLSKERCPDFRAEWIVKNCA